MKQYIVEVVTCLGDWLWTESNEDNSEMMVTGASAKDAIWNAFGSFIADQAKLGHIMKALHANYEPSTDSFYEERMGGRILAQIADGESSDYLAFRVLRIEEVSQ